MDHDHPGDGHASEHDHAHPHPHSHGHGHGHAHDHWHAATHGHPRAHHPQAHEHPPDHRQVEARRVRLERDLLAKNNLFAAENRRAFSARGLAVFNLIGSPGAGKTALLEATILRLRDELGVAVLEGDQATRNDAERIERTGAPVVQINTGAACHLDAHMVGHGAEALPLEGSRLLFVENVGNLVCPALFDLGERAKVVVMAATEGEDKPLKYPHVFRAANVLALTKVDLLPYLDFDADLCVENALAINPALRIFRLSARSGEGMEGWCRWLRAEAGKGEATTVGER